MLMCVQLVMNVPFTAVYFATYESTKQIIGHREEEEEGLLVQVCLDLAAAPLCAADTEGKVHKPAAVHGNRAYGWSEASSRLQPESVFSQQRPSCSESTFPEGTQDLAAWQAGLGVR